MATDPQNNKTRQGRLAALVIAATGVLWVGGTFAGNSLGWSNRTMALMDLLALAGFVFGLVVTYRIWRQRQTDEG
ncbi:hypothetical protein SAMN04488030_0939 [Aliiroseovarius halocynthiae]|uniref:DUF5337 domain-containing protein n=1 Tax=Aliiroseovarius halocynthiae TaxID=985055 RepID=A0A545SV94_9RHOB|nr:DUF5337 domain-containing protein [Aliiroseovarius halocynthiae]TQV68876.1 hypothetical protein FIL88_04675 [Aliiroseovarius halocynthiae]SMR71350.1 hypothetical protein SAMN04488030_0939 [Aliiroseovarius halocynthiae]